MNVVERGIDRYARAARRAGTSRIDLDVVIAGRAADDPQRVPTTVTPGPRTVSVPLVSVTL